MVGFDLAAWPLVLLGISAAALTWLTYLKSTPRLKGFQFWLLPTLRFAALFLLLSLLFEPTLQRRLRTSTQPTLAVLMDESQSMSRNDLTGDLPPINGQLQYYGFGSALRPLAGLVAARDTAPRTDIGQALEAARELASEESIRGILLISDGRYNSGLNPLFVAEELGLPVHAVAVGDSSVQKDVRIVQVLTNDLAFVGQEIPVEVLVFAQGVESTRAEARLFSSDSLVSRVPFALNPGESRVKLTHSPQQDGVLPLMVEISPVEEEASVENNRYSFSTRVLQQTKQILLVASAPHPDVGSIRSILAKAKDRTVRTYVQKSPGSFYEGPFDVTPDSVELVVLVGYPGADAASEHLAAIARFIQRGTPVLFALNKHISLDRLSQSFQEFLPALPPQTQLFFDEATFTPTLSGLRHPVLDIDHGGWNLLPPLTFGTGRWRLAPDAEVLGQASVRDVELDEPLLVVRNRDDQRTAMLLGSGTWRWLNLRADPQSSPRIWPELLENLVQWLTTPENNQRVRVTPSASTFDGSEPVLITGQVYNESLRPVSDAEVSIELSDEDGRQYPYSMQNESQGRYALRLESLPEGAYEYRAQAVRRGEILGDDRGSFTVAPLGLEFREVRTNTELLRQIALRSGGHYFTPASLDELPSILANDSTFATQVITQPVERELWRWPMMAILVLVLLSAEWVLRKRSGLV